jgi:hypothetical protein
MKRPCDVFPGNIPIQQPHDLGFSKHRAHGTYGHAVHTLHSGSAEFFKGKPEPDRLQKHIEGITFYEMISTVVNQIDVE